MISLLLTAVLWFTDSHPYMDQMLEIRKHLHQNPELSNREHKTQAYLKEQLEAAGFQDIQEIAGTGLKVVYDTGKPGRVLAFRADIDALPVTEETELPFASTVPGVMHACGHDVHTAILFGLALSIKNDPDIGGTFVFLFQPAEEGPPPGEEGGASVMIAQGALDNPRPEVIFGLHGMGWLPVGTVGYRPGGIMARADRFHVTIEGKGTHGSTPNNGVDALYIGTQVVNGIQSVVSRQTDPRDPVVVSFGQFNAGTRFNIIPGTAKLSGTIRTLQVETGNRVPQLMDKIIKGITEAHGAQYSFNNETMCPSLQNDTEWTGKAVAALRDGGYTMEVVNPVLAAEDFAYYAETIPGVYFFLGTCESGTCANIHEPNYAPAESSLPMGANMFYHLAKTFSVNEGAL